MDDAKTSDGTLDDDARFVHAGPDKVIAWVGLLGADLAVWGSGIMTGMRIAASHGIAIGVAARALASLATFGAVLAITMAVLWRAGVLGHDDR